MRKRQHVEVLWCPNRSSKTKRPSHGRDGWAFPKEVETKIRELVGDGSCVHFFGGKAKFGIRMDIDLLLRPDVIADAWLPPFAYGSFDTVILDPPYLSFSREVLFSLLHGAAYTARQQVIWLGHIWSPSGFGCRQDRAWLVRCGDSLVVRALQVFKRTEKVMTPVRRFKRGPAMKYNRWLVNPRGLPFPKQQEEPNVPVGGAS